MARVDPFDNTHLGCDRVAVNRVKSETEAERWVFYYYDRVHALTLDIYQRLTRLSKRHGWKIEEGYWRLASDRNRFNMTNPPMPDDVRHEAAESFRKTLRVGMWEEMTR